MIIKNFKLFENTSIKKIEVKNIIDDVLVDLEDLNNNLSWELYNYPKIVFDGGVFDRCHLIIKCTDKDKFSDDDNDDDYTFQIDGWVEVLERLFYLLNDEGIKVFDQIESFTEVEPGEINLKWRNKFRRNPANFEIDSIWWEKDFFLIKK